MGFIVQYFEKLAPKCLTDYNALKLSMEQPTHNNPETENTVVTAAPERDNSKDTEEKQSVSFLSEFFRFSLIAIIVVLPIRLFIAQPFIVSGASMEETFATGEYLIIDQVTYKLDDPKRGDVIVFRYPKDLSKFFIKRIIGMPGDTISIIDAAVTLTNVTYPNGVLLDEPYITHMNPTEPFSLSLTTDEYFVMGDNRDQSSDSRAWGKLMREEIIGRAYVRLFPFGTTDYLPGVYDIDNSITQ